MNSNLEILIESLQKEVDYLKSEMEECIRERDFEGAESFWKPLRFTSGKLSVLKSLFNPDNKRISNLEFSIKKYKAILDSPKSQYKGPDEIRNKRMQEYTEKSIIQRIIKSELELNDLKRKPITLSEDDDKLLQILDDIGEGEISKVEIEIKEGKS